MGTNASVESSETKAVINESNDNKNSTDSCSPGVTISAVDEERDTNIEIEEGNETNISMESNDDAQLRANNERLESQLKELVIELNELRSLKLESTTKNTNRIGELIEENKALTLKVSTLEERINTERQRHEQLEVNKSDKLTAVEEQASLAEKSKLDMIASLNDAQIQVKNLQDKLSSEDKDSEIRRLLHELEERRKSFEEKFRKMEENHSVERSQLIKERDDAVESLKAMLIQKDVRMHGENDPQNPQNLFLLQFHLDKASQLHPPDAEPVVLPELS